MAHGVCGCCCWRHPDHRGRVHFASLPPPCRRLSGGDHLAIRRVTSWCACIASAIITAAATVVVGAIGASTRSVSETQGRPLRLRHIAFSAAATGTPRAWLPSHASKPSTA